MPSHDYQIVYDLADQSDQWANFLSPFVFVPAFAFILVVWPQSWIDKFRTEGPKGLAGKIPSIVFFAFALWICVPVILGKIDAHNRYRLLEQQDKLTVTEGCLQGFHPEPYGGHDLEKVEVAGKRFVYSTFIASDTFSQTEAYGGPIHADSAVKIWHDGNDIIKLGVIDHACPMAPDLH